MQFWNNRSWPVLESQKENGDDGSQTPMGLISVLESQKENGDKNNDEVSTALLREYRISKGERRCIHPTHYQSLTKIHESQKENGDF